VCQSLGDAQRVADVRRDGARQASLEGPDLVFCRRRFEGEDLFVAVLVLELQAGQPS